MREKVVYVQYGGGLAIYRETGSIFKPIGGMDGYSLSNSKRSNQEEGINAALPVSCGKTAGQMEHGHMRRAEVM